MSVVAVYSIKGGVGKTAAAVNLSYLCANEGKKTLLCDMDPQGAASYYLRIRPPKGLSAERLLGGKKISRQIRGTDYPGLDLLPADFSYRNIDIGLDDFKKSTTRLRKVFTPLLDEFDHMFIDCPPNLTLLSENIFRAADWVLVPIIPTMLSINALAQLFAFLDEVKINRKKVLVFFSMAERRKKMHLQLMARLAKKRRVLKTPVPYMADVEKMGVFRQPVPAALPKSPATSAYRQLWGEIKRYLEQGG
ncbi:MAG: cobyrinic acid a,c-diamide synthase [Desulfobulbus propionicus]|nr:MAG: cobyrinic acid a,c-diamide synthase [Desulfobulbus propionicus]